VGSLGSAERGRHSSTRRHLFREGAGLECPEFEALSQRFPLLQRNTMRIMASACRCSKADFERYRLKGSPHAWLVSWFGCFRK